MRRPKNAGKTQKDGPGRNEQERSKDTKEMFSPLWLVKGVKSRRPKEKSIREQIGETSPTCCESAWGKQ